MQKAKTQISQVTYNARTQAFEATVTLHERNGPRRYACSLPAPITMPFKAATSGLVRQARHNHANRTGLRSVRRKTPMLTNSKRPRFDPTRWLNSLLPGQDKNVA